jgi:stage V sporulation protein AA
VWGVNVLEKTVYIRMRNRVLVKPDEKVYLLDIAQIIAPETVIPELKNLMVHHVSIKILSSSMS